MAKAWQVQEAKARFSEFLETSLTEGPQVVTKRGVETAVLVPSTIGGDWRDGQSPISGRCYSRRRRVRKH